MDLDSPAKRLRWARKNKTNYETGTDAARAFNWPISTYLGHENGDRNISVEAAKRYAAAYKVPWTWILDGGPITPATAAADAFISYSSEPPQALIDLLMNKIYDPGCMLEGSAEEKAVFTLLRHLKKQNLPK
jgi:transcriptional regulator with XRE-family HTH domain